MKKKIFIWVPIIAVMAVLTTQVFVMAQSPPTEETKDEVSVKKEPLPVKPAPKTASVSGKVTVYSIQGSVSSVAITTNKGESLLVIVDKDTKLTKTVDSRVTDITEGDVINVTYETESGANRAKSVNIRKVISAPVKSKQ